MRQANVRPRHTPAERVAVVSTTGTTNNALSIGTVWATLSQRYILVYPVLLAITGSPKASIMLSQMFFWTRTYLMERPERNGWFWHTQKDWYASTGLSRHEQDSARGILSGAGFAQERLMGAPARMHYRLDLDILGAAIAKHINGGTYTGWRWEDAAIKGMLGRPIAFLRGLVDITGSVTSALYLSDLCQQQRTVDRNAHHGYATLNSAQRDLNAGKGWLDLPLGETAQRLGLSTKRLRSARETLLSLDLIDECSSGGVQPRTLSRVNLKALADALKHHQGRQQVCTSPSNSSQDIELSGMTISATPDVPKAANWNGASEQSRPSTTGKLEWRNQSIQTSQNRQTSVAETGKQEYPRSANWIAGYGTSHIGVYTSDQEPLLPTSEQSTQGVADHRHQSSSGSAEQKGKVADATILPTGLSQGEVDIARQLLVRLPDDTIRQLVADEWAGQLQQPGKLHSPMGYLFGLIERARNGGFVPMVALRIAQGRNQRRINEATLAAARNSAPDISPTPRFAGRREIPTAVRERMMALGFGSRSNHGAR
jgi:hypothetical protein